jgi:phage terminase large subunit
MYNGWPTTRRRASSEAEQEERERARAAKHRQQQREREQQAQHQPEFRGANLEIQSYRGPEWILSGPAETGKTWATLWLLHQLLCETPGAQASLIRKTQSDIYGTVLKTFERVVKRTAIQPAAYGGEKPEWYDYPNGARLYIGGMDRPGKVLSGERDFIYVNQAEELGLADWETALTRTTGRGAVTETPMLFGDCNPGPPTHWIINRPSLRVFYSKHQYNPSLYTPDGLLTEQGKRSIERLASTTGLRHKRLYLGLWVSAEGTVYEFDPAVHLIDAMPTGWQSWRKIRANDFGYTNPFVCQWWAIDPDGRMYMYREIYMTQRTVKTHSLDIKRWSADERFDAHISDHDAEDRATMAEQGIHTTAADKSVSVGIEKVQERLALASDGKPRLFLLRGALVERDAALADSHLPSSTREEFDVYVYHQDGSGKANKQEAPVKKYDHGMDTMRYAVMYEESGRSLLRHYTRRAAALKGGAHA